MKVSGAMNKSKKRQDAKHPLDRFVSEAVARTKYNLFCLIMVDGSWSMGACLVGGIFPWQGVWYAGGRYYKRFCDVPH